MLVIIEVNYIDAVNVDKNTKTLRVQLGNARGMDTLI